MVTETAAAGAYAGGASTATRATSRPSHVSTRCVTGTSNSGNSVATSENPTLRVLAHQNLNSGSLRWKGRNSSERWEGRVGPSSSGSIWWVLVVVVERREKREGK